MELVQQWELVYLKGEPMKFGLIPPYRASITHDAEFMTMLAVKADELGFESIYAVEHAIVATGYSRKYPYDDSGEMALAEDCSIPDPLDLLAFLGAKTQNLNLSTGILVAPNHHPVPLAKRCATIAALTGGRLRLGVGVGWMKEELEACGVEFETRGKRLDEIIEVMRKLWADGDTEHSGEFFNFGRVNSYPKPPGFHIPIHIGGHSKAAIKRAGRLGDGIQPLGLAGEELESALKLMRETASEAGRDPSDIELTLGNGLAIFDEAALEAAEALGADRVALGTGSSDINKTKDQMEAFAEKFLS